MLAAFFNRDYCDDITGHREGHQTVGQERSGNSECQLMNMRLQLEAQSKRLVVMEAQLAVSRQYSIDLETDLLHALDQVQKLKPCRMAN